MKKSALFLTLILLLATALFGCGNNEKTNKSDAKEGSKKQLTVYTTIFPLEDFTKKIGGDLVNVKSIYPPGADAHTFEPTSKTMVEIADGDAFIYTGVGIEGFAEKAEESLKNEGVKFVKAGEGVELLSNEHEEHAHEEEGHEHEEHAHEEDEHEHDHGDTDPHVWLDPVLSIKLAENIKNALAELDPNNKEQFEENYEALKADLENLDKQFTAIIEKAPKKEILVSHAAYGYWQERYGIEQISVLGLSPTQEPSQKQLQNIIETAKKHNIKYVLFESNVSSKISDIVKNELHAEALTLHNLESISEKDVKNNEDYFSMMEKNIKTIEKALLH
ncbi:metal ABC transporter solute-binding protein, Zn/Mn family [Metabacillus fastidiosus]|uniref:metal ABC transporter solute-binding protein, Zn/Mn family n=1 Tax=Metabacillus fastidiosus TaxID=1458 RepID=UPI002E234D0C|nr:zinc ABC transporter substrate-binding protein [Metabacillus fastidiosus]MED4453127.1 zinc ABC transporter substrate-binding protein [Metabacillus fastidiosus]